MKKLEIIVRPEKTKIMKAILRSCNVKGAMFTSISGYGNQRSKEYIYNGVSYNEDLFHKTKIETVVDDKTAGDLIKSILEDIPTGETGDGKIFIYDIADVIRIRTGEMGEKAL